MKLQIEAKLGGGGFADVWKAKDDLDRFVAIKIIRPSAAQMSGVLEHAKALVRAEHPNVVSVLAIETVCDPESGQLAECIVMELIDGVTLNDRFRGSRFSLTEAKAIGEAIINGIGHIHKVGVAHGDLHAANVMIAGSTIKIIDILYRNSMDLLSSGSRESLRKQDLTSLRFLLREILFRSELNPSESSAFFDLLNSDSTLAEIGTAFQSVVDPNRAVNRSRSLEHAMGRLEDEGFVEGDEYASALLDETPRELTFDILQRVLDNRMMSFKHTHYVRGLWARLNDPDRQKLLVSIGSALDKELPNGRWPTPLKMLLAFGKAGWDGLPTVSRIRAERMIIKDVLSGHVDIHRMALGQSGSLGVYATVFWPYFANPGVLVDNLLTLLNQSWFTQNYVGKYFLILLPKLGAATNQNDYLIEGVRRAAANDARLIVNKIDELPPEWIARIRA